MLLIFLIFRCMLCNLGFQYQIIKILNNRQNSIILNQNNIILRDNRIQVEIKFREKKFSKMYYNLKVSEVEILLNKKFIIWIKYNKILSLEITFIPKGIIKNKVYAKVLEVGQLINKNLLLWNKDNLCNNLSVVEEDFKIWDKNHLCNKVPSATIVIKRDLKL
jgi:hypothetical protein